MKTNTYNPHDEKIDYLENFRGQFHFSPKSGWMNDINGLVYHGEKFHMLYQWGKKIRHAGYSTSKDLLHWRDEGVALIPKNTFLPKDAKQNAAGDEIFSGSAVIVTGKVAQKITSSSQEAIVAIYTGKSLGTCLAWSTDNGRSWHNYKDNPVANKTNGDYPRDPCVFWHGESSKWIMAIYENGTSFYGSADLINWKFLSNIDFGYECPDIYQLPLDSDENNMKWVLQDAAGNYLVGEFDGKSFRITHEQEILKIDCGPDFYAAQTFPRNNLPDNDNRIIQIAWMDNWNGGAGETIWERNATFPVSLGLVSIKDQIRITKNPIREISSLYKNTIRLKNQILQPNENILSAKKSKTFDLIVKFDFTNTQKGKFGFKIANKVIEYNIAKQTLLSRDLISENPDFLEIRILVDWGQLEVFANNGLFSYSEQFAFTPENKNLELFTDTKIKLLTLDFHEIERIWQ